MNQRVISPPLMALLLTAFGCTGGNATGGVCGGQTCPDSYLCVDNRCVQACNDSSGCDAGCCSDGYCRSEIPRDVCIGSGLAFAAPPPSSVAGAAITPAVRVRILDATGAVAPMADVPITVSLIGEGVAIGGTTVVAAEQGTASFADLAVAVAGTGYRLLARAGAWEGISDPFDVVPGPGASLRFAAHPDKITAGETIVPVAVEALDAFGNSATGFTGDVSFSVEHGAPLFGSTTVAALSGTVRPVDLFAEQSGTVRLVASSPGLTPALSTDIVVTPGPPAALVCVAGPDAMTAVIAGLPIPVPVVFGLVDNFGNASPVDGVSVALEADVPLSGSLAAESADGLAAFGDVTVDEATSTPGLRAVASGLSAASCATFEVLSPWTQVALTGPAQSYVGEDVTLHWTLDGGADLLTATPGNIDVLGLDSLEVTPFASGLAAPLPSVYAIDARNGLLSSRRVVPVSAVNLAGGMLSSVSGVAPVRDGYFVSGSFAGPVELGHYADGTPAALTSSAVNAFLARFDAEGVTQWVQRFDGARADQIAATADGGLCVTGALSSPSSVLDADGAAVSLVRPSTSASYVARFDPQGEIRWAYPVGYANYVPYVAATADGGCVAALHVTALTTVQAAAGSVVITGDDQGALLLAYGPDGALRWHVRPVGPAIPHAMARNAHGVLAVAISFSGDLTVDVPGASVVLSSATQATAILAFDDRGALRWTRVLSGSGVVNGWTLVATPSGFVSAGTASDDVDAGDWILPVSTHSVFAASFGHDGQGQWQRVLVQQAFNYPAAAALADGTLVFVGATNAGMELVSSDGRVLRTITRLFANGFVALVDAAGETTHVSVNEAQSPDPNDVLTRVAALPGGGFVTVGQFQGEVVLPDPSGGGLSLTGDALVQPYVAQYEPLNYHLHAIYPVGVAGVSTAASSGHARVVGVATLDDDVISVGDFSGDLDVAGGYSAVGTDVTVSRVAPDDELRWLVQIGGDGDDVATAIATDAAGDTLVAGTFDTLVIEAGAGISLLPSDGRDSFVARIDPAGALTQMIHVSGWGDENVAALDVHADGRIALTGRFSDTLDVGGCSVAAAHDVEGFVAMLEADGTCSWAHGIKGPGALPVTGVHFVADGSVVFAGTHPDIVTFYGTGGNVGMAGPDGATGVFIARYDAVGAIVWTERSEAPASSPGAASSGPVLVKGNTVWIGGAFDGSVEMGPDRQLDASGQGDGFVARIDLETGRLVDATQLGGAGDDRVIDLAARPTGGLFAVGVAGGDLAAAGATTTVNVAGAGATDAFVVHLDDVGEPVWARIDGGTGDEAGLCVAAAGAGSFVTGGWLEDGARFGAGEPNEIVVDDAGSASTFFIARSFAYPGQE